MKQLFSFSWVNGWAIKPMNNYVQFQAEGIKSVKEKQRLLLEMMIMEANSKLERERQNWSATSSVG